MWYCRHEIQLRQALFFSAASIAGAFSGLLAFAIGKMDGVGGLEGWRWIFILEGIVTVLVAISAFFLLYDFPETAGFLTEEERAFVVHRLKYQGQVEGDGTAQVAQAEEFQWAYVLQAFRDWQIWVSIIVYWGVSIAVFSVCMCLDLTWFTDCLPSLRHQPVPANHHQVVGIPVQHRAASDGPHLHHRLHLGRYCCVVVGSPGTTQPLYHWRAPVHGCGLQHVGSLLPDSYIFPVLTIIGALLRPTPRSCMAASSLLPAPSIPPSLAALRGSPTTCPAA